MLLRNFEVINKFKRRGGRNMSKVNAKATREKNNTDEKKVLVKKISKSTVRSMHFRT